MHRFEELKCIGRGSYGSAHLVRNRTCLEDRFVVKKIPMELLSSKERDQSFHEVELLAKLKHPNVVEYRENFLVNNVLHIVMAYCDGGDLAARIKTQQLKRQELEFNDPREYFPINQILDWFVQMAMAIQYLHGQRVLHRDLKSSNVFLTTDNVVKLGDFGIARTLESTLDQAKTVVGTPYYMSPEVCESKPYSYASDVWSLGCILYELLTLRHAFDAPNILTLILTIVQQDFAPIPQHYDEQVSELLHHLLEKDPKKRPSIDDIFAMPYIRQHMQGLVVSGGSLKVKVINQRPHASIATGRQLQVKNLASRRPSKAAPVVPMQWLKAEKETSDGSRESNPFDSQSSFRRPERSRTPEPLEKDERLQHREWNVQEEWKDEDEDLRFHTEAEELMNPNFQSEYSDECLDSLQIYYGSKKPEVESFQTVTRSPCNWFREGEEVLEVSHLSGSEGTETPSLSESSMMRQLELDADSEDDGDSSLSEYEAEENFYSDNSSESFDRTQFSDEWEDAEIIEYTSEDFSIENLDKHKLEGPSEVQWVIRNVAQSLLLTRDELHPQAA